MWSQNVKCPVLSNHLINPDSVHELLGNSAMNYLAPYSFCRLNGLTETLLSAENTTLLLFMLTASTNVTFHQPTAVGYHIDNGDILLSIFNN